MKTYKILSYGQAYRRQSNVDIIEIMEPLPDSHGRIPIRIWRMGALFFDMPHHKVKIDMAYGNMPVESLEELYQPIPRDWNMDKVYDNYSRRT